MTRPLRPSFVILNTLLLWATLAIASVQLWPIYQDPRLVLLIVVTTIVGSAIAILGAAFRWPSAIVVPLGLLAFLLLGVPLAVPDQATAGWMPSIDGITQLLSQTALGWKRLLTVTLPVGSYQGLLVPALVLLLVASIAGLTLALRARAGDLAAFAPVLVLIFGIAFGPESARFPIPLSLSLLVVILAWLMWRRGYRRRAAIRRLTSATTTVGAAPAPIGDHRTVGVRTIASGILIIALAVGAAVTATVAFPPGGTRQVIRSVIVQPFDPRDYVSPLSGFRKYLQPETADEPIFRVSGLPEGAYLKIATLDTYDGIVYSVGSDTVDSASGSFTRVPYRFDQSDVAGTPVSLSVMVDDYSGVWVPTVGQLESVDFGGADGSRLQDDFYYNDNAGTGAVIGGLETGDSYSLEAVIPRQPLTREIPGLTPGGADVPPIVDLPAELDTTLEAWTAGASTPGEQLAAMLAAIKANGYVSHGIGADEPLSRSGHSADRITALLTDQRMIGDAEQYSVLAALMARELGFPARVIVGFAPTDTTAGPTIIRGSSITAWIEVNTRAYGWVSIDPNPGVRPIPDEKPQDPTIVSRPPSIVEPPAEDTPTRDQQTPPDTTQDDPDPSAPLLALLVAALRIAGVVAVVVAILLAPFLAIIVTKVRRRRARRRAPTVVEQISGGWREYEDAVIDHGFDPPASATRSELARTVGGAAPVALASIADRAIFSPVDPDPAEADKVWQAVTDLRTGLDRGLTRRERIRALVSIRSLRRARSRRPQAGTEKPE